MNKHQIIEMLEYSGLAYSNSYNKFDDKNIYFINDKITDVQCYLRKKSHTLTIAFRGSDSKKDWLMDFKFWRQVVPYGNFKSKIKMHSGFLNAYKSKSVRQKIWSFITDDISNIFITGHSYGAALAIVCATDLEYNFKNKDYEVILFGCPRVGNNAFKESYNKRIFKTIRIENQNDIVPKVPFKFLGYRHVGAKIHIGEKKFLGFPSFKEHNITKYYSNIWNFIC
ncbi:MAG: lipase family protein [Oscillospiraceae bacterium]|jgi:predicted lipase|nr:lipase family protein [Oscillospiraceae bacterium]